MSYVISPLDFQNIILSLMDTYNSQTVAHAGYIVGLGIGVAAIITQINFRSFFEDYDKIWKRSLFLYLPLSFFSGTIIFIALRLIFWAWMSSAVLGTPYEIINSTLTNATYTPAFAIQNYTITTFMNLSNVSLSSQVYCWTYNSLDMYIYLIIGFSIFIFSASLIIDVLGSLLTKWIRPKYESWSFKRKYNIKT
jgi:hypothetical protein